MSFLNTALFAIRVVSMLYLGGLSLYLLLRVLTRDRFWPIALLNNSAPYVLLPLLIFSPISLLLSSTALSVTAVILLLIGAVWFAPYFLPKPYRVPEHPTLKVITFNMWGGNPMQSELIAWLRSMNSDVVFLQEVPYSFEKLYKRSLSTLYPHSYRQQTPGQWWANAVLSKYPIISIADLDSDTHSPSTRQRVVIEAHNYQIALYSIHLTFTPRKSRIPLKNWSILNSIFSYDESQRNREIDCLLSELKIERLPYIVAGDFNMSAQSLTYHRLATRLHDAFREVGYGLGGTWPHGSVMNLPRSVPPLLRIDYIWHSDHFHSITACVGPDIGSDHRPVIAQLEFIPNEA